MVIVYMINNLQIYVINCAVLQCARFENVESNHELTFVVGNTKLQSSVDTGLVLESLCKCCPCTSIVVTKDDAEGVS